MIYTTDIDVLKNESDVEQKFLFPFLKEETPLGLGYNDIEIFTKPSLCSYLIEKNPPNYYRPDYVINLKSIPVLIIEAKAPDKNLQIAFREARLYASETNAVFKHNINTCTKILVTNGKEVWAGFSDQAEPQIIVSLHEFSAISDKFQKLIEFCSKKSLLPFVSDIYKKIRGKATFKRPVALLGGTTTQNEQLIENSYGQTLVLENRNIFDPQSEADRIEIVKNAYVHSRKRDQHMDPIYNEIRKIRFPSYLNSTELFSDNPELLADSISHRIDDKEDKYALMLIIGNVGSGKTTFIRYFKNKYLEEINLSLSKKCEWVFLNINAAPVNKDEIYKWIRINIIRSIKASNSNIDFDELETLKKIYHQEINKFEKGVGKLIANSDEYNKALFDLLNQCLQDENKELISLFNFIKHYYGKIPIIVLDNNDKLTKDSQLLMFEVAQWLRENFLSIVILPMRDSTYDRYRNEKPLDTVVKDLVFRLDSPDILKVLQARINYIIRIQNEKAKEYRLENDIKIIVAKNEHIDYCQSLIMAIRDSRWTRKVFYKLTNRDIRQGIEFFEDLCKSGHIDSEEIFKLRTIEKSTLPNYKMMNALLRKNNKYFNGSKSNFANLFFSQYSDEFPDPFVRIDILRWLRAKQNCKGTNGLNGFFQAHTIIKDLFSIGHSEDIVFRELITLISKGLIFSETQDANITRDDLVKINNSGMLHLELLKNISFLAACAEDVLYRDESVKSIISERIAIEGYLTIPAYLILTVRDMVNYLKKYRLDYPARPEAYLKTENIITLYDLKECDEAIDSFITSHKDVRDKIECFDKYRPGLKVDCKVVYQNSTSLLCTLDESNIRGFIGIYESRCNCSQIDLNSLNENDILKCEIIKYNYDKNSFLLKFLSKTIL